jgi:hypothetical protein
VRHSGFGRQLIRRKWLGPKSLEFDDDDNCASFDDTDDEAFNAVISKRAKLMCLIRTLCRGPRTFVNGGITGSSPISPGEAHSIILVGQIEGTCAVVEVQKELVRGVVYESRKGGKSKNNRSKTIHYKSRRVVGDDNNSFDFWTAKTTVHRAVWISSKGRSVMPRNGFYDFFDNIAYYNSRKEASRALKVTILVLIARCRTEQQHSSEQRSEEESWAERFLPFS